MKSAAKLVILSAFTAAALAGCAVYEPGYYPGYDPYPYSYGPYAYGPPVYAAPPVYAGPPAFFSFSYRSRGHHHHGWHGRHW